MSSVDTLGRWMRCRLWINDLWNCVLMYSVGHEFLPVDFFRKRSCLSAISPCLLIFSWYVLVEFQILWVSLSLFFYHLGTWPCISIEYFQCVCFFFLFVLVGSKRGPMALPWLDCYLPPLVDPMKPFFSLLFSIWKPRRQEVSFPQFPFCPLTQTQGLLPPHKG